MIGADNVLSVRGESLCLGYYKGGVIESATNADGWFETRDQVEIDSNELYVRGRLGLMFVSGGENIHPEEIELALIDIPEIRRSAIVEIPDEIFGYRPVAFVAFETGASLDATKIQCLLRDKLPGFKIPDHIFEWPEQIPMDSMKTDRPALKVEARARVEAKKRI